MSGRTPGHTVVAEQQHPLADTAVRTTGLGAARVSHHHGAVLRLQRLAGNLAVAATVSRQAPADAAAGRLDAAAEELKEAMEGWGTDEDAIYSALGEFPGSGRVADEVPGTHREQSRSRSPRRALGADLDRALRLYYGHAAAVWDSAIRLRDATRGAGTDEGAVLEVLRAQTSPGTRAALQTVYRDATGRSVEADINDDFSGDELNEALIALREGPLTPDLGDAIRLRDAMSGLGTDEAAVYRVLGLRTNPAEIELIKAAYLKLTGRTLEADIREDFSGSELDRALGLIGTGTFTNEIEQDMFEGAVTVVRGRFDWRFEANQMKINVNANFEPDQGVTVPLATWQSQIDGVWNQYALIEPGGLKIPIVMSLTNSGDGKTIKVVENSNPGTYAPPDRANAGKWYPVMPADTAPHEYGHLIGLPDEYQRTHPDFVAITGGAPTGPANTSGKSNADIAAELNSALTGADETKRAADATTVLTNVGLIAAGMPQQGDFAQAVIERVRRRELDESAGHPGSTAAGRTLDAAVGVLLCQWHDHGEPRRGAARAPGGRSAPPRVRQHRVDPVSDVQLVDGTKVSVLNFQRLSGWFPPERELLTVEEDGSFTMWRSYGPSVIGRFSGAVPDVDALAGLVAATAAVEPTGPDEVEPDASVEVDRDGGRDIRDRSGDPRRRPVGRAGRALSGVARCAARPARRGPCAAPFAMTARSSCPTRAWTRCRSNWETWTSGSSGGMKGWSRRRRGADRPTWATSTRARAGRSRSRSIRPCSVPAR